VPVSDVVGNVTGIWRIRPRLEGQVERRGLGSALCGCARIIDDAAQPIIAVAEGVEDALSAWVLTTYPCWAALSTAGMAALELPLTFKQILICADADPVGLDAAKAFATRMRAEGREVRVIQPLVGKDANDVLRARRAA
jgi:putative DNA primase/helicase